MEQVAREGTPEGVTQGSQEKTAEVGVDKSDVGQGGNKVNELRSDVKQLGDDLQKH